MARNPRGPSKEEIARRAAEKARALARSDDPEAEAPCER